MNPNTKFKYSGNRHSPAGRDQWWTFLLALLITLLLHIGVYVLLPDDWLMQQPDADSSKDEEVELVLEQPDPEKLRYVEANPEAPENEPDRKDNYSFRSQQAADENTDTSQDNVPAVDGDQASQKIIQGSADPDESMPPESGLYALSSESTEGRDSDNQEAQASRPTAPMPLPPTPEFIRQEPEDEEGPGSSLEISGSGQQIVEESADVDKIIRLYRQESVAEEDTDVSGSSNGASDAKPLPRKRPRLSPDLVHGSLMRSGSSAGRRGMIAIDSTFSQFGEYEQQFLVAVQAGWYQEIDFHQPIDTSANVVVQFRMQADGVIDEVKVLTSTAGEIATLICQTALTKRSPFRPWTEEMIQVFGRERTMTITFSYR